VGDPTIARRVEPSQISGFMAQANGAYVSHQWIYSLICDDKARDGQLWKRLRLPQQRRYQRHLAKRAGLGKIPHRVGIEHRPADVEQRRHIGHWEGDTVLKGHKESGHAGRETQPLPAGSTATDDHSYWGGQDDVRLLSPRRGAVHTITG